MKRSFFAITAALLIAGPPLAASAQVSIGVAAALGPGVSVGVGYTAGYPPPALPIYSMPAAPYPNWQWIPGYWGYGYSGYYWVPGYWTAPPVVGYYWTPGYWGYLNGAYAWNAGYWGPSVGFYGGINYGYGYFGIGFVGGYWSGGIFNYNTAVMRVNRTVIRNVYVNRTVVHRTFITHSRVSFNGGRGGIRARPTRAQLVARQHVLRATLAQRTHQLAAARNRAQLASVNHGHPRLAAVQRPLRAPGRTPSSGRVASTHHNAPTTATHHNAAMAASASHHNASMAASASHHNASMAASHHYQLSSGATHNARPQVGYGRPSGGMSHAGTFGGHPSGGGRPPAGGGMRGGFGGRSGGGGRPPRG